jgi:hypothetical protein
LIELLKEYDNAPLNPVTQEQGPRETQSGVTTNSLEQDMGKKPDMVLVVITLFVISVLASGMAQSALF